jgi:peptidoglycan/LPS O-acetylase OafA/YrhL
MQGKHFDFLDGWRGLAISFLLIGHLFPVPGIQLGAVGVNLFFVLSGVLMARILFVQQTPLGVFYQRRISRVFPAHYLFLTLIILWFMLSGQVVDWQEAVMAALFVNNFFPGEPGHAVMPFSHVWSLSVEEHSYIVLSIVALLSRSKWVNPALATGFCAAILSLCGWYYWTQYSGVDLEFGKWLHSEVSAYGIFLSAFIYLVRQERQIPKWLAACSPLLAFIGILCHWWKFPLPVRTTIGVGLLALSVNLLFDAPKWIQTLLSLKPLRMLGLWSFSIYLWQQPFYLQGHRNGLSGWLALCYSLAAGIASFYLIEQPCRRYLNRVLSTSHTVLNSEPHMTVLPVPLPEYPR